MKKKIIKSVVFIAILLIFITILTYIVIPKKNSVEYGIHNAKANGIMGEKENTIDTLVVGDSESFAAIIPLKLWNDYGFTSYICGTPNQCLQESVIFLNKAFKKQNPKLVILESNSIYRDLGLDNSFEKIVNYAFPLSEYHSRCKKIKAYDFVPKFDYSWSDVNKGYTYSNEIDPADDSNYMQYSDKVEKIPFVNKCYLKLLNKYCENNNAKLIILSTPSVKNWNYERHNGVEKFADEEGIEYLDMNILKDEINIDWKNETRDEGDHLNHSGALKATAYLGKYLNEKNVLENHKNDENYSSWNDNLTKIDSEESL